MSRRPTTSSHPNSHQAKNAAGDGNRALDFDKILLPVHVSGNHWSCGCIDFKRKRLEYYDSFQSGTGNFFEVMRDWLANESQAKYNRSFDFEGEKKGEVGGWGED